MVTDIPFSPSFFLLPCDRVCLPLPLTCYIKKEKLKTEQQFLATSFVPQMYLRLFCFHQWPSPFFFFPSAAPPHLLFFSCCWAMKTANPFTAPTFLPNLVSSPFSLLSLHRYSHFSFLVSSFTCSRNGSLHQTSSTKYSPPKFLRLSFPLKFSS